MTILIDQPEFEVGVEERNKVPVDENELVLDGGFVTPETNSFGHTFRSCSLHFLLYSECCKNRSKRPLRLL
ncbi:hypothetical protein PTKIN_Ptkin17bG0131900 [Pterospermum kingtungense]